MAEVRTFDTGATRDQDQTKYDFEGFLSGPVLMEFAAYMSKNRVQSDGNVRASDNWQKGIPLDAYMKSAFRHFMDWWQLHRGYKVVRPENGVEQDMREAICGLLFNVQGYLHEYLKDDALDKKIKGLKEAPTPIEGPF